MAIQNITKLSEFSDLLAANDKVVVDFFAEWCGPCKKLEPLFEELASKHTQIVFARIDVDESADVTEAKNIQAMPTIKAYHKNKECGEVVGGHAGQIKTLIDDLLAK